MRRLDIIIAILTLGAAFNVYVYNILTLFFPPLTYLVSVLNVNNNIKIYLNVFILGDRSTIIQWESDDYDQNQKNVLQIKCIDKTI